MASFRSILLAGLAAGALALPLGHAAAQSRVATIQGPDYRIVGEREIAHRMADLVRQRNGGQPVEISFHGTGNEIEVPAGAKGPLQVESFSFDQRSGRFYAAISAPGHREPVRISGRAQPVEAIPVLKNRVAAGQVISRDDVEWLQVPANRYGGGYVDRFDDLIGQAPRRPLAAGMPIRTADIGKPEVIAKNGLVTMVAQGPGMTITTTGRAMEAGSLGDVIQVMNVQSKKTVQATVTGMNQVLVVTAPRLIAAN